MVYIGESWLEGADSATILQARERLKNSTDVIDKLTEDSGSYLNKVRNIFPRLQTITKELNS